jgi:HTH-type transcriptional regulator/antitoxin HigA
VGSGRGRGEGRAPRRPRDPGQTYEERRWPVEELDPIEAIETAAMAHDGHSRSDLAKLIGQSRATENLQRKRPLPMIRKIAAAWRVPEPVLIRDYALARKR